MKLTEESYLILREKNYDVWVEDDKFYCDSQFVKQEDKQFLISPPSFRLNALVNNDLHLDFDRFPDDINYNTKLRIGLTSRTIDYFGLRVVKVLYQSIDPDTTAAIEPIPIVFERYKYSWDEDIILPKSRVKEIYFYQHDGVINQRCKVLPKEFYNINDRADITHRRRSAIVAFLIARATELGLKKEVEAYFSLYKNQTDKYILYGDRDIISIVDSALNLWFNTDTLTPLGTIKNAIVVSFTKALEPTSNEEVTQYLEQLFNNS